jgi:penicillin-insensitive murein endopeptidase
VTNIMPLRRLGYALAALLLLVASPGFAQQPARELFGAMDHPTAGAPTPVGSYARGCLGGAVQLPDDGEGWQAMRLSRDRRWGTPELVDYIEAPAHSAAQDGWPGILVGDIDYATRRCDRLAAVSVGKIHPL